MHMCKHCDVAFPDQALYHIHVGYHTFENPYAFGHPSIHISKPLFSSLFSDTSATAAVKSPITLGSSTFIFTK